MASLKDAYFLRDLSPRQLQRFEAIASQRNFGAGEIIVVGNEPLHNLYVIASGRVRVAVTSETSPSEAAGSDMDDLVRLGPGECFGEFSYADRMPASASVIADEATSVIALPHQELDELIGSDPAIARKVLGSMLALVVSRLRSTDADLVLARYILRYV